MYVYVCVSVESVRKRDRNRETQTVRVRKTDSGSIVSCGPGKRCSNNLDVLQC